MKIVPGTLPGLQGILMQVGGMARRPRITTISEAEQRAEVVRLLTHLNPGEALIRIGDETKLLRTLGVPTPQASVATIEALKQEYVKRLMTPLLQIPQLQATPEASDPSRTERPHSGNSMRLLH